MSWLKEKKEELFEWWGDSKDLLKERVLDHAPDELRKFLVDNPDIKDSGSGRVEIDRYEGSLSDLMGEQNDE